ncbi:FHA domain-containing protein [uncultured Paraglaciecola sp.]|uniref:FHA domain-containing protein n=1 Tax=uncultured Paraglaciecola sp. TaxID=1765024 RepID=UPI00262CFE4F|nr:FHA domain-containing protein [uncultured Paraglaciecola sp.]
MARLDMYANYELQASFKLDDNDFVLGRDASCVVSIPDSKVSRKHAIITSKGDDKIIENIGLNGTKVNGKAIESPYTLQAGDAIFIASYILVYQPEDITETDLDSTTIISRAPPKTLVL